MKFFVVHIIDIHQLNPRSFGNSIFLVEDSLKIFFLHSSSNKGQKKIIKKKPISNEKERDFIIGHCIIFLDFFCLVMSCEPQT